MSKPIYVRNDISRLNIGNVFELDNKQIWYYLGYNTGGYVRADNLDWSCDKPNGSITKVWSSIKAYYSGEQPIVNAPLPNITQGMVLSNGHVWYLVGLGKRSKPTLTTLSDTPFVFEYIDMDAMVGGKDTWVTKIYATIYDWMKEEYN